MDGMCFLSAFSPLGRARRSLKRERLGHAVMSMSRCRRCGETFDTEENIFGKCRFHATVIGNRGYYTMVLETYQDKETKAYKQRMYSRWTCCGSNDEHAPGCKVGRHLTYDDEDERWEDDWMRPYGVWGHGMKQLK
uniref:C2H2-type domain-containing protein n=1 Tax=Rhodosorus marinus TaxID=101924 RepID=A0A7S3ECX5_9RHOD|mmetsp:Transcript_26211/g.102632  ORF Transcript_26211/g.102632 Transcript_26211/m.102632 type:complete len:136 (+) Transcript_26211:315-722(+)